MIGWRLFDAIGYHLLRYARCHVCGRSMWRFRRSDWDFIPTDRPGIERLVCRVHRPRRLAG